MTVQVNDVVQLVPEHKWSGCLVTVTEVKTWGIQGFVQIPMKGQAFIRVNENDYEKIGTAVFVLNESTDGTIN